jgi:hypothetical protein
MQKGAMDGGFATFKNNCMQKGAMDGGIVFSDKRIDHSQKSN